MKDFFKKNTLSAKKKKKKKIKRDMNWVERS